jgi:hypothetical protein
MELEPCFSFIIKNAEELPVRKAAKGQIPKPGD